MMYQNLCDTLRKRKRELESGLAQLQANAYATQGALDECERLLNLLDIEDEQAITEDEMV